VLAHLHICAPVLFFWYSKKCYFGDKFFFYMFILAT
jgi:hypothetical protein